MAGHRATNRRIAFLGLPILLAGIYLAGCQLAAAVYYRFVESANLAQPSAKVAQAIGIATRLNPGKVEYLRIRAYVEQARGNHDTALATHHESLAANPVWPHTWAAIARHRAGQGLYDERMYTALARSQTLGPSERSVQFTNAVLGIDHWYRMPRKIRDQVEPSIIYALTHESSKTLHSYIYFKRREYLYCRRFARSVGGEEWCRKYDIPIGRKSGA